jgi:hypothetical protein
LSSSIFLSRIFLSFPIFLPRLFLPLLRGEGQIVKLDKYVGSTGSRVVAIVLVLVAIATHGVRWGATAESPGWGRPVAWLILAMALLASILAFRSVYAGWMRFAKLLNVVVTTALFGLIYLLIVPPFAIVARWLDPLRLGRKRSPDTYWIERSEPSISPESLERMG